MIKVKLLLHSRQMGKVEIMCKLCEFSGLSDGQDFFRHKHASEPAVEIL